MPEDPFHQRLESRLRDLARSGRLRARRLVQVVSSTECVVDGQRCTGFASNDYLGLSHHADVRQAFAEVAAVQVGSGGSALVAGRTLWHHQLETDLARFEDTESASLFPTGYAANFGTLTSLITSDDAVFCDHDNHASIVDGCRASAGKMLVYRHDQLDRLRLSLGRRRGQYAQVFLVSDSVFSMDGTLAPLHELADLAEQFDALLIVDEAHGTGVFGPRGRGVCEQQQVAHRIPIRIGTLSKAVGAFGGFAAADQVVCDFLWNTARSQFFSTSLPPAVCAAASAALRVIDREPERRQRLHDRCRFARLLLQRQGLRSIPGSEGPILPIVVGDDGLADSISRRLLSTGFFIPAIRPPTVPVGTARLRMSLSADHSEQQISDALELVSRAVMDLRPQ